MRRFIEVDGILLSDRHETIVEIEQAQVGRWALELALVLHGLAEAITISSADGSNLVLTLNDTARDAKRTKVTRLGPKRMQFELSRTQADYMQAVLLRAYRDGMADVAHVHIEGSVGNAEFDLTLFFKSARPPMSPDEAAKLLKD